MSDFTPRLLNFRRKAPGTDWIGYVSPRTGLDAMNVRKLSQEPSHCTHRALSSTVLISAVIFIFTGPKVKINFDFVQLGEYCAMNCV